MDIEDLRTFVDVADAGGVSSAARRLGVSKSIVSRRLFRLEAELGVQLLARTTRGAALTEAGDTPRRHKLPGARTWSLRRIRNAMGQPSWSKGKIIWQSVTKRLARPQNKRG